MARNKPRVVRRALSFPSTVGPFANCHLRTTQKSRILYCYYFVRVQYKHDDVWWRHGQRVYSTRALNIMNVFHTISLNTVCHVIRRVSETAVKKKKKKKIMYIKKEPADTWPWKRDKNRPVSFRARVNRSADDRNVCGGTHCVTYYKVIIVRYYYYDFVSRRVRSKRVFEKKKNIRFFHRFYRSLNFWTRNDKSFSNV